jgi:AcrR family transcriptional regulator
MMKQRADAAPREGEEGPRRGPRGGDVRGQIVDAALETLRSRGFNGASARAIARVGGFNSALIFYYFGTVHSLLLAALDQSSEDRMERYREAAKKAESLEELADVATRIYREDVEGGHITVFSELVGASLSHPELAPEIVARAEPWLEFVEETIGRVLKGSAFEEILPTRDLAFALVAFYMGVNLLTHLDEDHERIDSLFALAQSLAPLFSPMLSKVEGDA